MAAERDFSKRVWSVLKGTTSPITTGGWITLPKDTTPTITLKDNGQEFTIEPAVVTKEAAQGELRSKYGVERDKWLLNRQVENLQGLLDKIPQAAFGQGQETVYDTSVRDALQLPAQDFEIDIPQTKMNVILAKIKNDLHLQTDITAELYSLNVYQQGGKFLKHKDTPRGDDMLGTLVICLPSLFKGGALNVSMGSINETYFTMGNKHDNKGGMYNWWKSEPTVERLPWAAFFADVDHEIVQVDAGVRMTVAYLIRRKDTQSTSPYLPRSLETSEQEHAFQKELGAALKKEEFLQDGGKIGSPCLHLYTNSQVFPGKKESDEPLTNKQIANLKGRDLMIASVADSFGLNVYLVPYLGHDSQGDLSDLRLSKFPKKKKPPRYMSEDDVETFFGGHRPHDMWKFDENMPSNDADVWLLQYGDKEQAETNVGSTDNYNSEGYYGNEASHTTFYVKAALFIEVPSFSESRGDPPTKPAKKRLKTGK